MRCHSFGKFLTQLIDLPVSCSWILSALPRCRSRVTFIHSSTELKCPCRASSSSAERNAITKNQMQTCLDAPYSPSTKK
ncbi:hypothetical protein QQF64_031999 [Cirrhinus molitorella]|uniref:Secreted protein n=1 Tax=Cirrhinus molitorella TaxID=172907 RepID=A0ABR3MYR5_9TELE